jgi:hypothetical protein
VNIRDAEARHIEALAKLFARHSLVALAGGVAVAIVIVLSKGER